MNLYIGNLNYNVREGDLRGVMEEYGTVASVKLITDRETRRSKGFAFVEMPNDDEAKEAIKQLNGAEYVNRTMVVKSEGGFTPLLFRQQTKTLFRQAWNAMREVSE